jgi:hypothetical protein
VIRAGTATTPPGPCARRPGPGPPRVR